MKNTQNILFVLVVFAVEFIGSQALAQKNLIANGSYESPALNYGSVGYFNDSIPGWSVTQGCEIEIQNHVFDWNAASGDQFVELDSYCPTTIAQWVSTTPGVQYRLSFSYSARPGVADNRIRVRWSGVAVADLDQSGMGLSNTHWATVTLPLTATASAHLLEFEATNEADTVGGFIDNVQLVQLQATHSFTYSASNTANATVNTVNQSVTLSAGQHIALGTCGLSGASGNGDTYLRLFAPDGSQIASNDDSCGVLSYIPPQPAGTSGTYQIHAGCFSSTNCNGTVVYTIQ